MPSTALIAPELWSASEALHPYPASVRARSLALAARLGHRHVAAELTRAARAVALQLEIHLLGNHFLENGIALNTAAAVTTGPEAAVWRQLGVRILDAQLDEQFLPDGGHFERSGSYHGWLVTGLLELTEITRAFGGDLPLGWKQAIQRAVDW
ncbi:MAG: hypothetical protein JNK04_06675, partial [Myxococcales bacterium]|nr:hypothetical protein [Myxococcales bacterium]